MPVIKAILFDLGDTLLDFGPINTTGLFARGARLAYRYLQRLGFHMPPFRDYHRRRLWAIRWHYVKSRITQREFDSLGLLAGMERSMGHLLTPEQTEELAWQWYRPLGRCASVEEGLHGVLDGFRKDGLSLGIVSNTFVPGEVLDRHLAELRLLEYLPLRVYSCDVRYRKPHARIFQIALDRLAIRAAEAVFVGDSLFADVAGARRVGMISVLKDPTGAKKHRRIRPNHRVTCLKELPRIVASYDGA
jgi:HAD superfamily hydrolase (TIGR01549 family)